MDCHLAVVEGLVRFSDPENSAGRGMWASGRYNQAGKIDGEKPDQKAVNMANFTSISLGKIFFLVLSTLPFYIITKRTTNY